MVLEGYKVEEVREFGYLGFVFQRNGRQEAHVKNSEEGGSSIGSDLEFGEEKVWKWGGGCGYLIHWFGQC